MRCVGSAVQVAGGKHCIGDGSRHPNIGPQFAPGTHDCLRERLGPSVFEGQQGGRRVGCHVYRSNAPSTSESSTNLRDQLTGLPSPQCFEAELAHVSAISDRYRFPLTLIGCRFALGEHSAQQNRQLRLLAEAIGDRLRTADTACRWDPGTFMILLPNTTANMAGTVAKGIRETFEHSDFGQNFQLTAEIKIVQHEHGEDPMSTLCTLENKLANTAE